MVTILPRFDPGGDIGRSFGSGVSEALSQHADRQRIVGALDNLKSLDLEKMSLPEILTTTGKAFAGIPGGMQYLEALTPQLVSQKRALDYASTFGQEEGAPQGQTGLPAQRQPMPQGSQEQVQQPVGGQQQPMGAPQQPMEGVQGRPDLAVQQQRIPGAEEARKPFQPLTRQEFQPIARRMALGGATQQQMDAAFEQAKKDRRAEWEAEREGTLSRREQAQAERGLESEQLSFLDEQLNKELGSEADPYYKAKAYELFNDKRNQATRQGKSLTDTQIWNQTRKEFNDMKESLDNAKQRFQRPFFNTKQAQRTLKGAKDWAQNHLQKYGNTREDRDAIATMFTDLGYDDVEAQSFVRPMSEGLNKAFSETEVIRGWQPQDLPPTKVFGWEIAPARKGFKPVTEKGEEQKAAYIDDLSTKLADSLQPTDSLVLLRERLVRDRNLNEEEFEEVLESAQNKMQDRGKIFSPEQLAERPKLSRNVRQSLTEIFTEGPSLKSEFRRMAE